MENRPTWNDLLVVLARALDLVGVVDRGHSQRVAVLANEIAARTGFARAMRERIVAGALLHDIGVSSTHVHDRLVMDDHWCDQDRHCERGERLVRLLPSFGDLAGIVRRHHTPWQHRNGLSGDDRFAANVIYLADRLDAWLAPPEARRERLRREEVFAFALLKTGDGTFAPEFGPAIVGLGRDEPLLASLEKNALEPSLDSLVRTFPPVAVTPEDVRALAYVLAAIVDAKCPYTAEHSFRVARIAADIAEHMGLASDRVEEVRLAGLVHDVGKLGVADEIVSKPDELGPDQKQALRRHVSHSYVVLSQLPGMERIARYARWHHERMDAKGYPDGIGAADLPEEARILAASDALQGLSQSRPGREALESSQARASLEQAAKGGQLDPDVVELIIDRFHDYWQLASGPEGVADVPPGVVQLSRVD